MLRAAFAQDLVFLRYAGLRPVVVHGGGPQVTVQLDRLGIASTFTAGLRVTTPEMIDVVRMVLSGKVNKDIVSLLNRHGSRAIGLCGDDGLLFRAARQPAPSGQDIGFVGRIERVDVDVLRHVAADYIPVIASVGADREGNSYNINADDAAAVVVEDANAVGRVVAAALVDQAGRQARDEHVLAVGGAVAV